MTVAEGRATGRSCKTYYQTGTRASPGSWVEIELVAESESFDPGKENTISGAVRSNWRKYQENGAQEGAVLKFTYHRPRGITDDVFTALLESYIPQTPAVPPYEWAVMDDDIAETGAVGWKFFGEVVNLEHKRDLDKFIEYEITVEERLVYESSVIMECIPYTVV